MMGTHTDVLQKEKRINSKKIEIAKNRFENMFKNHASVMLCN